MCTHCILLLSRLGIIGLPRSGGTYTSPLSPILEHLDPFCQIGELSSLVLIVGISYPNARAKIKLTSPYYPQGNAIVERSHRTLSNMLRTMLFEKRGRDCQFIISFGNVIP